jgi:hypothetical protein
MKNKKVIIVVGLIALAGVGFYLWNRSKKAGDTGTDENSVGDKKTGGAVSGGKTTVSNDVVDVVDESKEGSSSGTNIKDLKGKEKREFRKETRDVCAEKYGKGLVNKKYNDCKKRVKGGGVAFTGDFDDFQNDYIDFKGQVSNQFMFSNFENDLNMDL